MSLSCSNIPNKGKKSWGNWTFTSRSKYEMIFTKQLCLFNPWEKHAVTATLYVNCKAINHYQLLPNAPHIPSLYKGKLTHFIHLSDKVIAIRQLQSSNTRVNGRVLVLSLKDATYSMVLELELCNLKCKPKQEC